MPGYSGNPTGAGNPPGQFSPSYTKKMTSGGGQFINESSYRGNMSVGRNESAKSNNKRPTSRKTSGLESWANKENPIPEAG